MNGKVWFWSKILIIECLGLCVFGFVLFCLFVSFCFFSQGWGGICSFVLILMCSDDANSTLLISISSQPRPGLFCHTHPRSQHSTAWALSWGHQSEEALHLSFIIIIMIIISTSRLTVSQENILNLVKVFKNNLFHILRTRTEIMSIRQWKHLLQWNNEITIHVISITCF